MSLDELFSVIIRIDTNVGSFAAFGVSEVSKEPILSLLWSRYLDYHLDDFVELCADV